MANTFPSHADRDGAAATLPVVRVRAAAMRYGAIRAVDGVDLAIMRGEVFGLIGHNGAGKTTLFKMMLGLIPATSGEIWIGDAPVTGSGFRAVRRKIGYLPENVVFYDNLSGLETLRFFARLKGVPVRECGPLLERVGLARAAQRRLREYSKGMRQRLGLAQALLGRPTLLFLDEPTNGLDPEGIRAFYDVLRNLRAEDVTIVLTSHILAEIQERVDRLAIMAAGRIRAVGSVHALRGQTDLPLRFDLELARQDIEPVRAALAQLPVMALDAGESGITVQCARASKMRLIEALGRLDGKIIDIRMREPSLEDVFFGFAD